jgi:hypothetical protein
MTSRKPILEWFDGLRREGGFILRSTCGNDRVLKWKIIHIRSDMEIQMLHTPRPLLLTPSSLL